MSSNKLFSILLWYKRRVLTINMEGGVFSFLEIKVFDT